MSKSGQACNRPEFGEVLAAFVSNVAYVAEVIGRAALVFVSYPPRSNRTFSCVYCGHV